MSFGNTVKLDIGGTVFETSKWILIKSDGMFKTMLETGVPVAKDKSGCISIDRSPKHFVLMLKFMRDGHVKLPDSEHKLEEIQIEAQYYLLTGLNELCEKKLRKRAEAKSLFGEEAQVLYTRDQMLQVITNPKKPVLIIYYQVGLTGRALLPKEFHMNPFLDRHKHKLNIFFKSYLNDQQDLQMSSWVWSFHDGNDGTFYRRPLKEGDDLMKVLEEGINDTANYHKL